MFLAFGAVIQDFNPDTTEQADLRGGRSPWFAGVDRAKRRPLTQDIRCDVLIVGCGITGSLMAEELTRQGLDVVMVDRELPGRGSTAGSTSMLLWEIDRSLQELTHLYGYERAARAYRASFEAVHGLMALVPAQPALRNARQGFAVSRRRRFREGPDRGTRAAAARRPARRLSGSPDAAVRV
ncbi:FAD-dependent oxidoreductase [Tardiphaga sp.]|uniref:FAD-dependent oxidoreductase n=1 Tax=Tardiphaga sp. TaxID=1926292 RepID=UPI003414678E